MKLSHLSPSRINTFDECQLKYYAKYDVGLPEPPPHPNTLMGSALHWMFDKATKARIAATPDGSVEPMHYRDEACQKYRVQSKLIPTLGEMTRNAVDWGYFRNIEHTVGCEIRFSFKLRDGTKVVGVIDRLDVMAPRADVLDLKTQKRELDDAKLMDNWQARIYNMGARELHPEVTESVSASFWVLRHRVQRVWLHQVHADRDRDELMRIADKIRDCKEPVPSPSGLCPWCPAYAECDAAKATRR